MSEQIKSRKRSIIVGVTVIIIAIFCVLLIDRQGSTDEEKPNLIRPLKMFTVGDITSSKGQKYPAKIGAEQSVNIAFQVGGPLVELPVSRGDKVKKGQILAKIDPSDYINKRDSAKSSLKQTQVQLARVEKAAKLGAVSQTDLTNAKANYEKAQANYNIAEKAFQDTILYAPFDAVIANTFVSNFENVQAKQEILSLQDINSVEINVAFPEERILRSKQKPGEYRYTVFFDSLPEREFEVRVKEYSLEADPLTQTYLITFSMPSPNDVVILPGMTAMVQEYKVMEQDNSDEFLVPFESVAVDDKGHYYVWLVKPDKDNTYIVHRQDVKAGEIVEENIFINQGLKKGVQIAAAGINTLSEGQKVYKYSISGTETIK